MEYVLTTSGLCKSYGRFRALDDLQSLYSSDIIISLI